MNNAVANRHSCKLISCLTLAVFTVVRRDYRFLSKFRACNMLDTKAAAIFGETPHQQAHRVLQHSGIFALVPHEVHATRIVISRFSPM